MNGKGDKRRKKSVDEATWEKNWNRIFKKDRHAKVENDLGCGYTSKSKDEFEEVDRQLPRTQTIN